MAKEMGTFLIFHPFPWRACKKGLFAENEECPHFREEL